MSEKSILFPNVEKYSPRYWKLFWNMMMNRSQTADKYENWKEKYIDNGDEIIKW